MSKDAKKGKGKKAKKKASKEMADASADADAKMETKEETPKAKGPKDGRAKFHILDSNGDTVRTFSRKLSDGMNRIYWGMNRNGVRYPSRRDPRPNADPAGGGSVLPGDYKVVIVYGDFKDSTEVSVKADPRLPYTMEQMKSKDAAYRQHEAVVAKATEAYDRIKEAKKTIKRVNTAMETVDKETKKEMGEMAKKMNKEITRLERRECHRSVVA